MTGDGAITDADRPDPKSGREASLHYAEAWLATHRAIADPVAYRAGYADMLLIDAMLSGYRMLDVGCGTGGYLTLARNAAHVTAIDFSRTMIDAAQKLGLASVRFQCCRFEDFDAGGDRFDVVRMGGVVGWYQPWIGHEDMLVRARDLAVPGGIIIATYVPPANPVQYAKALLLRGRTVVTTEGTFRRIVAAARLAPLVSIRSQHAILAFLRKPKAARTP